MINKDKLFMTKVIRISMAAPRLFQEYSSLKAFSRFSRIQRLPDTLYSL